MSSFTSRFEELCNEALSSLSEIIETFKTPIPNYEKSGLEVSKYELLLDGYLITHITDDTGYDERGQQCQLSYLFENDSEALFKIIDDYSDKHLYRATCIEYDVEDDSDDEIELPDEFSLIFDFDDEDYAREQMLEHISSETGFTVKTFMFEKV